MIERAARPGGAMVNTGTIPSKVLRETALLCTAYRHRPLPGMEYQIDTTSSMTKFMARRHLAQLEEHDRIEASFDHHGIDVRRGTGRIADEHSVVVSAPDGTETTLTAQYILIATGSSPVQPDHIPFDQPTVVDADGVLELDRMPKSLIIVGGGVIGCEYACTFGEIGVAVTLIEPREAILPFLDAECRDLLVASMRDAEITVQLGDAVEAVSADRRQVSVVCESERTLEADALLWAAGRSSNTTGIGLESVGVATGNRGLILVNEHYQTNVPSIYAAGDVIGFPALASTSMEQGRIAACDMFNIDFKSKLAATLPMGLYTIPAVSMVGINEAEARETGRDVVVGRARYHQNARARMLGDDRGLIKCVFDRQSRELLGATIVGAQATELIHIGQALIVSGSGVDYLIDACFNYPSLSELYKYAAYSALQAIDEQECGAAAA